MLQIRQPVEEGRDSHKTRPGLSLTSGRGLAALVPTAPLAGMNPAYLRSPEPGIMSLSKAVRCLNTIIDYCKWAYEPYRLRFVSAGELFVLNKYVFNNLRVFMEHKAVRGNGDGILKVALSQCVLPWRRLITEARSQQDGELPAAGGRLGD